MNENCIFITVTIYDTFLWLYSLIIILAFELSELRIVQFVMLIFHLLGIFINYSHIKKPISCHSFCMFIWKIILAIPLIAGMSMSENYITFIFGFIFLGVSILLQMYFSSYVSCEIDNN